MASAAPHIVYMMADGGKGGAPAHPLSFYAPGLDAGGLGSHFLMPQFLAAPGQGAFAPHLLALAQAGVSMAGMDASARTPHHGATGGRDAGRGTSSGVNLLHRAASLAEGEELGSEDSDDLHGRKGGANKDNGNMSGPRGIKEKNREAQRRFRARQKVLISGLKDNMDQMQTRVAKQEQELACLREENAVLRQLLASAQQAAAATAMAAVNGSAANNNSHHHHHHQHAAAAVAAHAHMAAAANSSGNPGGHVISLAPAPTNSAASNGAAAAGAASGGGGAGGLQMQRLDSSTLPAGTGISVNGSHIFIHHPGMPGLGQQSFILHQPGQPLMNLPAVTQQADAAAPPQSQSQPQLQLHSQSQQPQPQVSGNKSNNTTGNSG